MGEKSLTKIAVFGAGGFGLEVMALIEQINEHTPAWEITGFFDDNIPEGESVNNYSVLGGMDKVNNFDSDLALAVAVGNPKTKKQIITRIINKKIFYPVLIHPSAVIGNLEYVKIGKGTIVCSGVNITSNITIGDFVLLNLSCTVGHETIIGDYSSFMPSCNISGEVCVGDLNYWGTGSIIINKMTTGTEVIVGAGAVIVNSFPDNVTVVGVPAKIIAEN